MPTTPEKNTGEYILNLHYCTKFSTEITRKTFCVYIENAKICERHFKGMYILSKTLHFTFSCYLKMKV